jgi:hypothetical protein
VIDHSKESITQLKVAFRLTLAFFQSGRRILQPYCLWSLHSTMGVTLHYAELTAIETIWLRNPYDDCEWRCNGNAGAAINI